MTLLSLDPTAANGTSSALSPTRTTLLVLLAAGAIAGPGTSASPARTLLADVVPLHAGATSGGGAMLATPAPSEAALRPSTQEGVSQLRRMAGLTWDLVGRLFGVSRRSAHFWASGKPMTAEHEEHLARLLGLLAAMDAPAEGRRAALLAVVAGEVVLDRLAARRYAEAEGALTASSGADVSRPSRHRTPLSPAATDARRPLPPGVLAAGEAQAVHPIEGRGRAVKSRRGGDRGQS